MYTTYSIYGVLALSHQCECVSTKITSITEECLSRNRRIVKIKISCTYKSNVLYVFMKSSFTIITLVYSKPCKVGFFTIHFKEIDFLL